MENNYPTFQEVRNYLINDNDWTAEEVDQLAGYAFRHINQDGTTTMTRDQWTIYIMDYCNEHIDL
ncbi:hypothetical protein SEA_CHICKENKING_53 [Microbacterium phage ChickenKing]|nr:hypothetical protein SEA_CHICKENKING_53 [Microbacterium phage ChickenKing]